jgi:hypothetical protein
MLETRHAAINRLRQKAREIAARQPQADFYRHFAHETAVSSHLFHTDAVVCRLHVHVAEAIENDYGHGMAHAQKVALDAGTLTIIEGRREGFSWEWIRERVRMAHCAGLLHDIERRQPDHARRGAEYARRVLSAYPFSRSQAADICTAIASHEAFGEPVSVSGRSGGLLSDCLYDADKFRFGPDNFTHTVWDMIEVAGVSLERFVARYNRGINFLEKIKETFRTPTGRRYGPQFIDLGLAIGDELYSYMKADLGL